MLAEWWIMYLSVFVGLLLFVFLPVRVFFCKMCQTTGLIVHKFDMVKGKDKVNHYTCITLTFCYIKG